MDFSKDIFDYLAMDDIEYPEVNWVYRDLNLRVEGVRHPLDEGDDTTLKYLSELEKDHLDYEAGLEQEE